MLKNLRCRKATLHQSREKVPRLRRLGAPTTAGDTGFPSFDASGGTAAKASWNFCCQRRNSALHFIPLAKLPSVKDEPPRQARRSAHTRPVRHRPHFHAAKSTLFSAQPKPIAQKGLPGPSHAYLLRQIWPQRPRTDHWPPQTSPVAAEGAPPWSRAYPKSRGPGPWSTSASPPEFPGFCWLLRAQPLLSLGPRLP